jgi:serine acetyltransferase
VTAGTVVVRDVAKHKTVVLKKGKRYVARAPKVRKKR